MFDLEQAIAHWRKTIAAATTLEPQMLDELENHLRETVHQATESGIAEPQAFEGAVAQLGAPQALAEEFQKLKRPAWLPAKIAGVILYVLAALAFWALARASGRYQVTPLGVVLAIHVCVVTLGYGAAVLVGVMGACFVIQRSFTKFSSRRLDSIRETSCRFAGLALCLSAVGTGLGMIWAKGAWGRFWDWDPKEIGAFCVLIWLAGYLAAHRYKRISARGLLTGSILTSVIVDLAWLGPNFLSDHHTYGWSGENRFFAASIALNLLFVPLGFAPAGWLRPRRT